MVIITAIGVCLFFFYAEDSENGSLTYK